MSYDCTIGQQLQHSQLLSLGDSFTAAVSRGHVIAVCNIFPASPLTLLVESWQQISQITFHVIVECCNVMNASSLPSTQTAIMGLWRCCNSHNYKDPLFSTIVTSNICWTSGPSTRTTCPATSSVRILFAMMPLYPCLTSGKSTRGKNKVMTSQNLACIRGTKQI